jgi:hypothetical protein
MIRILALVAITAMASLYTCSAQCTWCGNAYCLDSSACFQGCACMKDFGDASGVCVPVSLE